MLFCEKNKRYSQLEADTFGQKQFTIGKYDFEVCCLCRPTHSTYILSIDCRTIRVFVCKVPLKAVVISLSAKSLNIAFRL